VRELPETGQVLAYTAAIIEHAPAGALPGGGQDQTQAALLAGTPNIGWLAAQGGALQVARRHWVHVLT
jgi:hypothetical protein